MQSCVAPAGVSGWLWNQCPDDSGISVRISLESLSGCSWNGCPSGRGIRSHGDKAEVDVEIELILRQHLLALLACDFWGEETGHELTGNPFCWVVDPNDGTSDFLKGLKGSAVSVGLLHNNIPVLGVVYAPVIEDRGADCIAWAEGVPELLRNGQPVRVDLTYRQLTDAEHVMVSAAAVSKPQLNAELCAPGRFVAMPSIAYRLARVAAGDGLCAVSLYPVSAHDVVAGHALLRASGGTLVNQDGVEIDRNRQTHRGRYPRSDGRYRPLPRHR